MVGKSMETENRLLGMRWGELGVNANGDEISFCSDRNVLELHSGNNGTTWRNILNTTELNTLKCVFYVI